MKHWLQAFRLRTLPLAVSSIIVGSALAHFHGAFEWTVFTLALLTAVLLQVLSNLANDLGDHQHGTDNKHRVGPQRAVQSGAISPSMMRRAMIICGSLAFTCGVALIITALGISASTLAFLLLGLAAIGAAVKYTFGRDPYGYAGLGDVSVFLFFGLVGVCGTFYLHMHRFEPALLLPACAFGFLSAGVLNVNNMRDIVNDGASGKRTIVVRMGGPNARIYHTFLVIGGVSSLLLHAFLFARSPWQWVFIALFPVALLHLRLVWRATDPRTLDPELKRLALFTFFTALTFSLGLIPA